MKSKNNMKLIMESFNKFLEEDKIEEMKFNPMGLGQLNPMHSFPDYMQAAYYAVLVASSEELGEPEAVNVAKEKFLKQNADNPNAGKQFRDFMNAARAAGRNPETAEKQLAQIPQEIKDYFDQDLIYPRSQAVRRKITSDKFDKGMSDEEYGKFKSDKEAKAAAYQKEKEAQRKEVEAWMAKRRAEDPEYFAYMDSLKENLQRLRKQKRIK
jgi:hypothetical protein